MDAAKRWNRIGLMLVVVGTVGRCSDTSPGACPSTEETLRAIGRRLSEMCSERDLTAIATRGPAILDRLEPAERAALGRGYLRFHVDRSVVVDVAAPTGSTPFWLADRGFRATGQSLVNPDATWRLYR